MDSLLAGNLILPLEGSLCRYDDVQRRYACRKHSGHRESHSGLGRKPFAFPSESLFTFSPESPFTFTPESLSRSSRNPFHLRPESAVLLRFTISRLQGDRTKLTG
jgi:hypothetical protein